MMVWRSKEVRTFRSLGVELVVVRRINQGRKVLTRSSLELAGR